VGNPPLSNEKLLEVCAQISCSVRIGRIVSAGARCLGGGSAPGACGLGAARLLVGVVAGGRRETSWSVADPEGGWAAARTAGMGLPGKKRNGAELGLLWFSLCGNQSSPSSLPFTCYIFLLPGRSRGTPGEELHGDGDDAGVTMVVDENEACEAGVGRRRVRVGASEKGGEGGSEGVAFSRHGDLNRLIRFWRTTFNARDIFLLPL